jgi:hypothetical protein
MGKGLQVTFVTTRVWSTLPAVLEGENQQGSVLEFVAELGLFDVHILEFAGIKDFATLEAFHEFRIFITGHDLHTGVLACPHALVFVRRLRRDWRHKSGLVSTLRVLVFPGISGILD